VALIAASLGQDVRLLAVVKAAGYGHGAAQVARAALAGGAFGLVVSTPEEAAALLGLLPPERLLIVGGLADRAAADAARVGCAVACSSLPVMRALETGAALGRRLPVHLNVDSGMGRLGCAPEQATLLAAAIASSPRLQLAGVMTHLAAAESDPEYTAVQLAQFDSALSAISARGLDPGLRHAANSAGALQHPLARYDAVRCGIALYGYEWPQARPALSLRAMVVRVQALAAGASVGYGRTWRASRPSVVATLAIGYADGVLRSRSNRGHVLLGGKVAPLIGAVSMDSVTVDVTDLPEVALGDVATLIGDDLGADLVASWSQTITYEVLTSLGDRVERRHRE